MSNKYETPIESEYSEKIIALANSLNTDIDNITEGYTEDIFEADGNEYLVVDDDDADNYAKENIEQSLWAFNPSFIIDHTDLPYDAIEIIEIAQEKCEDANDTIYALIDDIDEFVSDAIASDGRVHFMNSYDDEEIEEGKYYIYRVG